MLPAEQTSVNTWTLELTEICGCDSPDLGGLSSPMTQ